MIAPGAYHPRRLLINGETLILRGVRQEDAGQYTCLAENSAGNAIARTILNVTEVEVELELLQVTSSSATVAWSGSDRDANVFQLQYRYTDDMADIVSRRHR